MAVPVDLRVDEEKQFHSQGWMIADFENNKLKDKQIITVTIPRTAIPENAVKIDLEVQFLPVGNRSDGDAYTESASL